MTIFEGVIDYMRTSDHWPSHLPLEASVDAVTADFSSRLHNIGLASRFKVRPTGIFGGFIVCLTGTDPSEEARLRQTRNQLRAVTNLNRADHAGYGFHITLAYPLRWFTPDEAHAIMTLSGEVGAVLAARLRQITLGPVEFCTFDTMHHFETLHLVD